MLGVASLRRMRSLSGLDKKSRVAPHNLQTPAVVSPLGWPIIQWWTQVSPSSELASSATYASLARGEKSGTLGLERGTD